MIDAIKSWLTAMVATAIICSAALAITPEGAAKKAVRLVCGFAMMIALISIAAELDYSELSLYLAQYRANADGIVSDAVSESSNQTRYIIEQECEAYILDKAQELQLTVDEVSVTARWSDDGYWYPVGAGISGSITGDAQRRLSQIIESELGIAEKDQIWSTDDET